MPEHLSFNEYQQLALRTAAEASIESPDASIQNAALGFAGEGGEFCDLVKKLLFHGHLMTDEVKQKLRDEVGDILWYCALACRGLDTTMEQVARDNVRKLAARYPEGFSQERSRGRYTNIVKPLEEGETIIG